MKKKQYIQPSASVLQVGSCAVICGSGDEKPNLPIGTNPGVDDGKPIIGEAPQRRNSWDDYENL